MPAKLTIACPRLGYLLGLERLHLSVWLPDYFYTAHATTLAGVPYNRGWTQGLGFLVLDCHWRA